MGSSKPSELSPTTDVRAAALDALSPDAEPQAVVGTVLRELHSHHPAVRLDDVLELAAQIDLERRGGSAPATDSLESQVQHVLNQALAHLSEWNSAQMAHHSRLAHTPLGTENGSSHPDENRGDPDTNPPH